MTGDAIQFREELRDRFEAAQNLVFRAVGYKPHVATIGWRSGYSRGPHAGPNLALDDAVDLGWMAPSIFFPATVFLVTREGTMMAARVTHKPICPELRERWGL